MVELIFKIKLYGIYISRSRKCICIKFSHTEAKKTLWRFSGYNGFQPILMAKKGGKRQENLYIFCRHYLSSLGLNNS